MSADRITIERRKYERHEPECLDDEDCEILSPGDMIDGVVGDISKGGICIIVLGDADLHVGEEVCVNYRDSVIPAVVRNISTDVATHAYGLEWLEPQDAFV